MKRVINLFVLLIMAIALMIAFSACGEKEVTQDVDEPILVTSPPEEASQEEDVAENSIPTPEPTPVDYTKFTASDLELSVNGNQLNIHNKFGDASTQYAWYVLEGDMSNRIDMKWYTESPDFSYAFTNEDSTYFVRAFVRNANNEEIKKDVFIYDITFKDGTLNYDIIDYRTFTITDIEYNVNGRDISVINHFGNKYTVYAWYVYEGSTDNKIETIWYTDSPQLTYTVSNAESVYFIRCFCRDQREKDLAYSVITEGIKIS
jgi:hypothetical protein